MLAIRKWFASRPVLAFYLLALLFSWSYWLALLADDQQVRPGSSATHLPGLVGPMVSAIIVTTLAYGRDGLHELIRSAVVLPRPRVRNAMLAFSPVVVGCAVFVVLAATGTALPSLDAFSTYPGLPGGMPIPLLFFIVLVLNGYGEEVGWRGFATRHLVTQYGKVGATLVVAVLWLVWHAPLFWLNANMQALVGPVILGWAFGLICGSFVLAGLYFASGNSILVVALWHTLYNFTVATPAGKGVPAATISTVVMIWGAYFVCLWVAQANIIDIRKKLRWWHSGK